MRYISTRTIINAPVKDVWKIFTNFSAFSEWNPLILAFEGNPAVGSRVKVVLQLPNSKPMIFKPVIQIYRLDEEISWLGNLLVPGLFDGRHSFKFKELDAGTTMFIHEERFSGILLPFVWGSIDQNTRKGFELMNEALKKRCEEQ